MTTATLRLEAWRVLEGEGAILDTARGVSKILRDTHIRGAVVGGIAVGLHGHLRAVTRSTRPSASFVASACRFTS